MCFGLRKRVRVTFIEEKVQSSRHLYGGGAAHRSAGGGLLDKLADLLLDSAQFAWTRGRGDQAEEWMALVGQFDQR